MQKVEEEGEIVMVKEHRELDRTGTRKGHIVIKVRQTRHIPREEGFGNIACDDLGCSLLIFQCNFS